MTSVILRAQIAEGLAYVLRSPALRAMAVTSGLCNLTFALASAVNVIFLTRDLVVVGTAAGELGQIGYAITSVSLRQRVCPDGVLARVNAAMRVLIMGLFPVGALAPLPVYARSAASATSRTW